MKKLLATLFVLSMYCSLHSQDLKTMAGDWIRVRAEYLDGKVPPDGHSTREIIRFLFAEKEVYHIYGENTFAIRYTRTGNVLKIGPIQQFIIGEYTEKALTLVEAEGPQPVRYYMIPTDSFQRMGIIQYPFEVINSDTIYTKQPGIEPIYPKGQMEFMTSIMRSFTQNVRFKFTYVVRQDGTIGDVTVTASSNPKSDDRLIKLVKKTPGKWIPATYKGKTIHVLMSGAFERK